MGYGKVHTRAGNGYAGWPDKAPFDAIVVTAAPEKVPRALIDQLAVGGKMVVPVGGNDQHLTLISRTEKGIEQKRVMPVLFVPMTSPPGDH